MSRPSSEPPPIEEWGFGKLLYEKCIEEVRACHAYELARQIPKIVKKFNEDVVSGRNHINGTWVVVLSRKQEGQSDLSKCFPFRDYSFYLTPPSGRKCLDFDFEILYARNGFPELPYLEVFKKNPPPFSSLPIPERPAVSNVVKVAGGQWADSRLDRYTEEEIAHLLIRWDLSDDKILKGFKSWLNRERKDRLPTKVKKRAIDKYLSNLKKLGASRLLKHFPSIEDAMEHSEVFNGSRLFETESDWSDSKSGIAEIITDWRQREIVEFPAINAAIDKAQILKNELTRASLASPVSPDEIDHETEGMERCDPITEPGGSF